MVVAVVTATSVPLGTRRLAEVRELLGRAFAGALSADDWDHALGGTHVLVLEDDVLVGHVAVVERTLAQGDRRWRTGYVEALAVAPERRGRGHGARLMAAAEDVIRHDFELGALSASELGAPLYAARGWQRWRGATWVASPTGPLRTPDEDDAVHVLVTGPGLDLRGDLTCDWREGDVW